MAELRKCKECGKLFQPKGREQYCSDTHYRPCPICGTPVVATYLSDPPRRCDKCKSIRKQPAGFSMKPMTAFAPMKNKSLFNLLPMVAPKPDQAKSKPTQAEELTNPVIDFKKVIPDRLEPTIFCSRVSGSAFKFVRSEPLMGWIPGHIYNLTVDRDNAAYIITSDFDRTVSQPIEYHGKQSLGMRCTSQLSFYNYFQPMWQEELSVD